MFGQEDAPDSCGWRSTAGLFFLSRSKTKGDQLFSLCSALMILTGTALFGEEGRLPLPLGPGAGQLVAQGGHSESQASQLCVCKHTHRISSSLLETRCFLLWDSVPSSHRTGR